MMFFFLILPFIILFKAKFQADIKIRAEEGTNNEEEYFVMKDIKVSIQIGGAKGYFTNLRRKNSDMGRFNNLCLK